jgi:membrane protease YdiL (CAAX protease family)
MARNSFGLAEAIWGLCAGFVLASLLVSAFGLLSGHSSHPSGFGSDVASLCGLWAGLVGAAVVASLRHRRAELAASGGAAPSGTGPGLTSREPAPPGRSRARRRPLGRRSGLARDLADDYGLALRPWPDIPLGIAVGLASQYLLVPLLELPLAPFVPHLFTRLGQPAQDLTSEGTGAGLVLLGVLVCLGSPLVEEIFFRGVLLRAVASRLAPLGPTLGPVVSVLIVGLVFGLVHFEALQLIALVGFGVVLCVLAWRTGRLGPGIVAHVAFNTAAFVTVARSH